MAIEQGLTILSWFENLQEDERPPEYLWEDPEGLELWWATVEDKRNDDGARTRGRYDETDEDDDRPTMTQNEYAKFLKR